jgi:hypothetical protein
LLILIKLVAFRGFRGKIKKTILGGKMDYTPEVLMIISVIGIVVAISIIKLVDVIFPATLADKKAVEEYRQKKREELVKRYKNLPPLKRGV